MAHDTPHDELAEARAYDRQMRAPLSPATVATIRARLADGTFPRRTLQPSHTDELDVDEGAAHDLPVTIGPPTRYRCAATPGADWKPLGYIPLDGEPPSSDSSDSKAGPSNSVTECQNGSDNSASGSDNTAQHHTHSAVTARPGPPPRTPRQ